MAKITIELSFWMQSLFARNILESFLLSILLASFFFYFIYLFLLDTLESFTLKCILIILIGQSMKPWTPCLTLLETATQRSVCEGHFCHLFPLRRGNETTGERYKLLHMK